EIDSLRDIAVRDAVFGSDVLMLPHVVLGGFGDSHGGEPRVVESPMIATPAESVEAIDELRPHRWKERGGDLEQIAAELARRYIRLAAGGPPRSTLVFGFGDRDRLREDPERRVVFLSADALGVPDDVVVENGFDDPALALGGRGELLAAEETLLLSSQGPVN